MVSDQRAGSCLRRGLHTFLKTYFRLIREYFPAAKIITCGMSNPTGNSAALIQALANFTDSSGKTFDYTSMVDGYGTHTYPPSDTTQDMVQNATSDLTAQGASLSVDQQNATISELDAPRNSRYPSGHRS